MKTVDSYYRMTKNTHNTKKESSSNLLSFVNSKRSFSINSTTYDDQSLNCYGMAVSSSSSATGKSASQGIEFSLLHYTRYRTIYPRLNTIILGIFE